MSTTKPLYPYLRVDARRDGHAAVVFLGGQADLASRAYLEIVLAHLAVEDATAVHLHVANLDFCDVGSLRQLLLFARDMRQAGREVATCGARPMFRRLSQLLGVHGELGIA
jgi:anti-anti-sigma regulatory factor